MKENLTKEELLKFSVLGRNIKKIEIANDINLYQDKDYIDFKNLFQKIIKNKYLKYGTWLNCYTHIYHRNGKVVNMNISCFEHLGNSFQDIFKINFENEQFSFQKGIFENNFELLNTKENHSINSYFLILDKLKEKLQKGIEDFLNQKTLSSKNFHKNIVKYTEKKDSYEIKINEILNEEKTFLRIKKGLEKFFKLEKDFNIYVNITSDFEYDHECIGNINYKFIIDIRTVYEIERIVSLEFPKSFSLGTFTYSISKNVFKWNPNLFEGQKYLSNKVAANKYTKKIFPKIFKETIFKEFES